jgi:hypothetical protein
MPRKAIDPPKKRIEVNLIFQGVEEDAVIVVGQWVQEHKAFAIEALTMIWQVRELIRRGERAPQAIALHAIESISYLRGKLDLIEQLKNFGSDSNESLLDDDGAWGSLRTRSLDGGDLHPDSSYPEIPIDL